MTWRATTDGSASGPSPPTATLPPAPTSPHAAPAAPPPPRAPHSPPLLRSNEYLQSLEPVPPEPGSGSGSGAGAVQPAGTGQAARDAQDASRLVGVCVSVGALALATELNRGWIGQHQELAMSCVFLAGYVGIIVEEVLGLSKAGVALIVAAALWSIRATAEGLEALDAELSSSLGEVSAVIFFLLGAMTVVEVVDCHQGFKVLTRAVRPASRPQLLASVAALTFLLSSVLDNLTTTLVMVALLSKMCPDRDTRRFLGAAVVVAANAGGAWTPIGDVTTSMLWIHGQITALPTMRDLVLPSAVSVAVPVAAWALTAPELAGGDSGSRVVQGDARGAARESASPATGVAAAGAAAAAASTPWSPSGVGSGADGQGHQLAESGHVTAVAAAATVATAVDSNTSPASPVGALPAGAGAGAGAAGADDADESAPPRSNLVLAVGLGSLVMVPLLRSWAGLPPHMGMLACLGFLWLVTDAIHYGEERRHLTVSQALKRVDSEAVLFFSGVLLAVAALERAGLLAELAAWLGDRVPQQEVVAGIIGLASAVVDNVPLVAATMGMYDMQAYPQDSSLWQLVAYCAGTGGSLLVIGSAAGVALMGLDRSVSFGWYARRITPWAAAGYFAGLATYLAQRALLT